MKQTKESEKALEARLVKEVSKRGGMAVKLTSQFHRGMPDRLVLLPHHTIAFVEMKSTGEKPSKLQEAAISQLIGFRFTVRVVDSTESLDALLASLDARLEEQGRITDEIRRRRREATREYLSEVKADRFKDEV